MISGVKCCISGAWAPSTSKVSTPALLRRPEADRFGRRHFGVALADNLGPAADDGALNEAEALEGGAADLADDIAGRAGAAAARRVGILAAPAVGLAGLRHRRRPCHSRSVPANAAKRLIHHYLGQARPLPWRALPGAPPPDPYRVWLSEVICTDDGGRGHARFERFVPRGRPRPRLPRERPRSSPNGPALALRPRPHPHRLARQSARAGSFQRPRSSSIAARHRLYSAAAIAAIAFGAMAFVDTMSAA